MTTDRVILVGAGSLLGALGLIHSAGPAGEAIADVAVYALLGLGAVAGVLGYRAHVLGIRRELEEREARGVGPLRRVEPPDAPARACLATRRGRRLRRAVVRCGRGRRRYR